MLFKKTTSKKKVLYAATLLSIISLLLLTGFTTKENNHQEKTYDLIITGGNLFGRDESLDIGIKDGIIIAIESHLPKAAATTVIDASNKLVSPSFVESHIHIDKALCMDEERMKEMIENYDGTTSFINISRELSAQLHEEIFANKTDAQIQDYLKSVMRQVMDMEIANGTTAIKTHVSWGANSIIAHNELKEEYSDLVDLFVVVPWPGAPSAQFIAWAENGWIDFIGGYYSSALDDAARLQIDALFDFAESYNLPIDLHIDEKDEAEISGFHYIVEKTIEKNMQGKVTCGHVTALDAQGMDDEEAAAAIARAKEADMNIITNTSCNMYLMGRTDSNPIRRGITRVDEFLKAGVNVAYASDNIRDPFRPFGNGDLLEEGLLTAQVLQYGLNYQLEEVFKMGTYNPAKNAGLENYGLEVGCQADLMILDAPDAAEALLSQVDKLYVLKKGRIVAQNGKITYCDH